MEKLPALKFKFQEPVNLNMMLQANQKWIKLKELKKVIRSSLNKEMKTPLAKRIVFKSNLQTNSV